MRLRSVYPFQGGFKFNPREGQTPPPPPPACYVWGDCEEAVVATVGNFK